jgi:DNA-binding IclR family transcriptional regulator
MQKTGVQTFDRGLEILRLLAVNKRMTASKLAQEIGIHQTSASRMLQSLQKAKTITALAMPMISPLLINYQ